MCVLVGTPRDVAKCIVLLFLQTSATWLLSPATLCVESMDSGGLIVGYDDDVGGGLIEGFDDDVDTERKQACFNL